MIIWPSIRYPIELVCVVAPADNQDHSACEEGISPQHQLEKVSSLRHENPRKQMPLLRLISVRHSVFGRRGNMSRIKVLPQDSYQ